MTDMGSVAIHKFTNDPTKAWEMIKIAQKHVKLSTKPPKAPVTNTSVRFVCISDTHAMTSRIPDPIPMGDVLLHAGDITKVGHPKEISEFNTFLGEDVRCITRSFIISFILLISYSSSATVLFFNYCLFYCILSQLLMV